MTEQHKEPDPRGFVSVVEEGFLKASCFGKPWTRTLQFGGLCVHVTPLPWFLPASFLINEGRDGTFPQVNTFMA